MFVTLFLTLAFHLYPSPEGLNQAPAIMLAIADCESHQQQFKSNGSLVRDHVTGDHVGIFQISMKLHYKSALKMGYDITTPEGNVSYALYLYHQNGTKDWNASKGCWQPVTDV